MTAAAIVRTPQLHTALDLKRIIDADHLARGIACVVEVDVWAPEASPRGGARVTIELGDGVIGEPRGHYQPGAWWPVNPTTASIFAIVPTLDSASTITSTLSGTPDAGGDFVVAILVGGTTGAAGISYAVSVDGGDNFAPAIDLGTATTIAVHGVTIDLGAATLATAGDTIAWSMRFATSDLAAPMLDNAQTYVLSIHAPAPSDASSNGRAAAAQDATDQLMRATMMAIRRQLAAPLRAVARTTWPKRIPNYPAFVYGSLCVVSLVIGSPILDDAASSGQALQLEMTGVVDLGAGPVAVVTALET